ncbi:hypothetical protein N7468_005367 [Penicillium chermesinum]|uniref:DSBA-like thioredoxin domain-containing protein n=1 Tax=Penicillium chermesinum TaxID=63820 RepID=A0A9W9NZ22_9EURO|nr:uncharacterized protein N7468_005367 [Penicillium chermesinum]KAJ5232411.1 hypothetical protein N7468_005367 [Penicillium chermesinum]
MAGKIDAYVDCVSPYSYYATQYLRRNRKALESHGVEVENKPPWTLPAKGAYSKFDSERACRYFGLSKFPSGVLCVPELTIAAATVHDLHQAPLPARALRNDLPSPLEWIFHKNIDISKPENLAELLQSHGYSDDEVKSILGAASTSEFKQALTDNTQAALDKGAYGAPWFWVRNKEGKEEPFFGSDRFAFMWQYLGLPFQDIAILEKSKM